jgi:hypothetical protein
MKLPHEDETRAHIQELLGEELRLAGRLLQFATSIFTAGRSVDPDDGLDDLVITVALGLAAKMCKQYRSIIALVELGLGEDASSLARAHFESMLAVQFLLRRRVSLKRGGKKLPPVSGKPLTTRFRTQLYVANALFHDRKLINGFAVTPGMKRDTGAEVRAFVDANAVTAEAVIGKEWADRVKERGYSGLSVEHLACSLGYQGLYASLYRVTSRVIHANDAGDFAQFQDEAAPLFDIVPSPEGIDTILKFASLFLIHAVDIVNMRLGFGMEHEVLAYVDEVNAMRTDIEA